MDQNTGTAGDAGLQNQTGVIADAAGQQQTGTPDAGELDGLKAAAAAERKKRQDLETELAQQRADHELLREQLAILQAGRGNPPPDTISQAGLTDQDFVQVGNLRKILTDHTQQTISTVMLNQFATAHPDYSELVGSFDASGRFRTAETLKEAMKNNPGLRGLDIALAQNPAAVAPLAYEVARMAKEHATLKAQSDATSAHLQQRQLADQTAPLSASSVSGAAGIPTEAAIEASDQTYEETLRRVKAGEFG